MGNVVDMLRAYEDEVLVPLVVAADLEPVRDQQDVALFPRSLAVLVNNAERHRSWCGAIHWSPLTVVYMDEHNRSGDVYRLEAKFLPEIETVQFAVADLCGVLRLERQPDCAAWIDPMTSERLLTYPIDQSDRVLMHSWYLFQGAILPLLKQGSYQFVDGRPQRAAFQRNMIHHMAQVYREVV